MKILVIIEHDNQTLKEINLHVMTAALQLGQSIDLLIIGCQCKNIVEAAKKFKGIRKIYVADNELYKHQLAENTSLLISEIASEYNFILGGATTFGKNLLPRVAALLNTGMISDVTKILSENTFQRPMYAGNILATVQSSDNIKILSIRGTAFSASEYGENPSVEIASIDKIISNDLSFFEGQQLTESSRPELTTARIIISGGRAFKSAENFKMLEKIADVLGAAIGASRAAVDAGFAPNDYQVGQTGKIVAPDLYIAIGISGAIQHLAGMKDSKVIVAINNDPDAAIFQVADYGLVGDLFKVLPEFEEELKK